MKYKTLFILFGCLSLLLLAWNIFMFSKVSGLQNNLESMTQKREAVEEFNEIVSYDLETYKDSVKLLKLKIKEIVNKETSDSIN